MNQEERQHESDGVYIQAKEANCLLSSLYNCFPGAGAKS